VFSSNKKRILDTKVLIGLSSGKWDKPESDVHSIAKKLETLLSCTSVHVACSVQWNVESTLWMVVGTWRVDSIGGLGEEIC
jgi:hypothetical protein